MVYKVLYVFRKIGIAFLFGALFITGCKSTEGLQEANTAANTGESTSEQVSEPGTAEEASTTTGESEKITVTYKNQSSNIQISLDPSKDQFYLDLRGMAPSEKDSIVVADSAMIKNRAKDIQSLLTNYRKAQDLFYLGEYREALEQVDSTLEIQETADAYALKGTIFFMMENITAARANWNRAVQLDPNIPVPSIPELESLIDEIRGGNN